MTQTTINRRTALAAVAAVPAAVVLATPALAEFGVDAELRQLWAKYLEQLDAHDKAHATVNERRDAYDAEAGRGPGYDPNYDAYRQSEAGERRWRESDLDRLYGAWNREDRKLRRIVKAIRKAKAESMFGVGVKLSVLESASMPSEDDFAEAIEDARVAIADLTGVDFISATGSFEI